MKNILLFFFFCSSEIHKVNSPETSSCARTCFDCCILKIDVCNYSTSGDEFLSKDTATQASIIKEDEGNMIAANNVKKHILSEHRNDEGKFLALSIRGKLIKQAPSPACIFRFPKVMQDLKLDDYVVPQIVSIGPYHHGKENLDAMEKNKLWYLHGVLDRLPNSDTGLEHLVERIRGIEQACRDCYDGKIDLTSDTFVEMMVVDGCFIIEFLYRKTNYFLGDHVTKNPSISRLVLSDLFLQENQIPWLVLECLFQLLTKENTRTFGEYDSVLKLTWPYIDLYSMGDLKLNLGAYDIKPLHLLDSIRISIVGVGKSETLGMVTSHRYKVPSVTELLQVGVKFKLRDDSSDMLDIRFLDGVLEIPEIGIQTNHSLFINLISLEHCEQGRIGYEFTSYARFLHYLVKSSRDANFLMKNGIIRTGSTKEDIAILFNSFCTNTTPASSYFVNLTKQVHFYHKDRWLRRCLVQIKRDYLYNPSSIWSISNAVILVVVLTLTQTVYTVLSYYQS